MKNFWRIDSLMECEYDKIRINYENVPFYGGKMKKVIFDVDGVLLSEERYFDIAALTVWEILYSPKYMGMPAEKDNFIAGTVNEGRIAECRKSVWGNGTLISWLKARGINSNWDMVHAALITIFWIMAEVYSARSGGEKVAFRLESEKDVQETGKILMGIPVPPADKIEMGEDSTGGDLRRRCHSYTGSSNGSVFCQSGYMGRIEIFFLENPYISFSGMVPGG